jgi:asparagine synthase (glutamine-hydrolysing)
MCGIFSIINHQSEYLSENVVRSAFECGKSRGPEYSTIEYYDKWDSIIGFHRLAINGLNSESNQPIIIDDIALICNGEIYNYKKLYKMMDIIPHTQSDCEVIIHLYKKYGIEQTLRMIDGVFTFVLYTQNEYIIARDPYGVRPLYFIDDTNNVNGMYIVGSELKSLIKLKEQLSHAKIEQFKPGHYIQLSKLHFNGMNNKFNSMNNKFNGMNNKFNSMNDKFNSMNNKLNYIKYHSLSSSIRTVSYDEHEYENKLNDIYESLKLAVYKRCETTERPIACLLSGGLDSSLIASIVNMYMWEYDLPPVETYSIGLLNSEDVKYARIVAEHIGSKHTEVIVTEKDMISAIPQVIYAIESYDTTTVRASIGNYLIGKYISEHSEAKVIFNGDGSDEICGGYLYMNKCPDNIEFDKETIRLLSEIYLFDVQRSDRSISSNGLEPRTPFLDKHFVNTYLSIPVEHRRHQIIEKFMLREAFSGTHLLPDEIIWRKKEAFSDGVSNHGRSLFQIIQEYVLVHYNMINENLHEDIKLIDLEKKYYLDLFLKYYPNQENILPHYWMPKYSNTNDPSARTLEHYDIKQME